MLLNNIMDISDLNITNHCIQRMKERKVSCELLFNTIKTGSLKIIDGRYNYTLHNVKVIVDMKDNEIITCYRGDFLDTSLHYDKDEQFEKIPKRKGIRITRRNRKYRFR